MGHSLLKVAENVYGILTRVSNIFFILDSKSITLIDTGWPGSEKKVFESVRKLGYSEDNISHILITHADGDHIGSAKAIAEKTNANIYAHQKTQNFVSKKIHPPHWPFPINIFTQLGFRFHIKLPVIDIISQDGDTLPIGDGIQVIETPGHAPGHVSFYLQKEKILFAGDALMNFKKIKPSPRLFNGNHGEAEISAQKLLDLEPRIICPGHGKVWYRDKSI